MRTILKPLLAYLTRRVIARYHPLVVGITGSVGKTTTKEAIYTVLREKFSVRKNNDNFNNEFGVPYTVLGIEARGIRRGRIIAGVIRAAWLAYGWPTRAYPQVLVLELAADHPGDIAYLTNLVKPKIGVVTAIGETPVHLEFYRNVEALAKEKAALIKALPAQGGVAVLNQDDPIVLAMRAVAKTKVRTYGLSNEADMWASEAVYSTEDDDSIGGLAFKIHAGASFIPAHLTNIIAMHQIYAILAAIAVGEELGLNLVEMLNALKNFSTSAGRMNLLTGIKQTTLIDDTYNASPLAVEAALKTLDELSIKLVATRRRRGRRVAVLGDMLELGEATIKAHERVGSLVAKRADLAFFVGDKMALAAAVARQLMPHDCVFTFADSATAAPVVQEMIRAGDVILVKGSHSIQMEKIVDEIREIS